MARIARYVVPDLPHHVTQRGNRRERIFFGDDDYRLYRDLLREACDKAGVAVWAYVLMPNHVHLILTPSTPDGLARALGKAHRRYSAFVNVRLRVTGYYGDTCFNYPAPTTCRRRSPTSVARLPMARIARYVVPDLPHHVTQRGNRRERIFFGDDDYRLYRDLLREACDKAGVAVWAYVLMPNHVHLILTPSTPDGLARALGKAHRRYSAFVNARLRVTGHLFQSRFGSVVMDEDHLMAAARYVALNPVRAGLVGRADHWPWSSVRAHLAGRDDGLANVAPLLDRLDGRFADLLETEAAPDLELALRAAEGIGRPLGSQSFLDRLAALTRRDPRPGKPGRRRRAEPEGKEIGQ